jgi:hypothetical protein
MERVWSIGRIAKHLGVDPHRVRYAIESRGVPSIGKCGNVNAYDDAGVEQIRQALEAIERGKESAPQEAEAVGATA